MIQVLIFIAFLIVYILYLLSSFILFASYVSKVKEDKFLTNELLIVIPNLFLFAFVFIVGKFFNLYIVLISILVSNIGILLVVIMWGLLGSPKVPYKAIGGWAGFNFGIKNPWFDKFTQIVSLSILIAYPVIVGICFFGNSSVEGIRIFTLKSTIILILSAYLLMLPIIVNALSSKFIDEDSRARYLIAQFSGLIPYFLFISLLFWTLNPAKPEKTIPLGNMNMSFDPLLFTILMIYFIIFFLLPYFIGIQRAKQLKETYFEFKDSILDHLVEAIDLATPKTIDARLESIEQLLGVKYKELTEGDKVIELGLRFDDPATAASLSKQEVLIYNCYKEARPFDKRFAYFDFLAATYQNVTDLKNNLANEQDAAVNKETIKTYSAHFKDLKKELGDANDKKDKSNPALWIGIVAIASPFVSQIVTEIGKHLVEYFKTL